MEKEQIQGIVRAFLVVLFILWAFRLVYKFEAHIDATLMLLFSLLIYRSKNH